MPMRRMDAESLNDTMLLVSGRLDETPFGVPAPVEVREDGLGTQIETPKGFRRSIYVSSAEQKSRQCWITSIYLR